MATNPQDQEKLHLLERSTLLSPPAAFLLALTIMAIGFTVMIRFVVSVLF